MSRYITTLRLSVAVVMLLIAGLCPTNAQGNYSNGSYQQFYDELSPYGEWIDDPQNGYVWIPDAGDDFRPYYSNGYWANTEYGNTWVSNYPWGWAPFHYGRWTYSNFYGWVWIPGSEWGPAWVSWRSGGGSYGWAPLGPGVSINISFGNNYYVPDFWWTFTPQQYILNPGFQRYCYGPRYNTNYVRQTTIINNTYVYNNRTYVSGPRRSELERATGRPVQVASIRNSNRPDRPQLRGNNLSIYRPAIAQSNPRSTERPRRFRTADQPIAGTRNELASPTSRDAMRSGAQDRSQSLRQGRNFDMAERPGRGDRDMARPRIERPGVEQRSFDRVDRQPSRSFDVDQPQRGRGRWNNVERAQERNTAPQRSQFPEQPPVNRDMNMPRMQQSRPAPPQRMDRGFEQRQPVMPSQRMDRSFEQRQPVMPSQRMERPVEQRQPMRPAQRMERPMMESRQAVPSQRMEAPRTMPQYQAPAAQPMRGERPQSGNRAEERFQRR